MNLSPERFEQVLTDLADRADSHQVLDRVPAVRSRARHHARRRAGGLVAAVVVLVALASGVAGFGGLPLLRGEGPGPAAKPDPSGAYLTVQLVRDEETEAKLTPATLGGRVVVEVTLRGRVPQASGLTPGADVTDNLRELVMETGEGSTSGRSAQAGFHCDAGAPLVDIDTSFPVTVQFPVLGYFPLPGPAHLTFKTGACAPVGDVEKGLDIVLK